MNMQPPRLSALLRTKQTDRFIADDKTRLSIAELESRYWLKANLKQYVGKCVMIRTSRQLSCLLALLALDGVARRVLLCPLGVSEEQLPQLIRNGEVEMLIEDGDIQDAPEASKAVIEKPDDTEWVLFTSGTSGLPKLVQHSFSSLIDPLRDGLISQEAVWSTFYDIRRYGGLQMLLRALMGGSMVLSQADEPVADFLHRLAEAGVTHISGTPSHWRNALMSGAAGRIAPRYVRLSGEVAGQDILNRLQVTYPAAEVGHAYASTEAGVAFTVNDRREGFSANIFNTERAGLEMKIQDCTLRIRSSAAAKRYLALDARALADAEGFVDTGDLLELREDRYIFLGRREGVVNVGGQKVYPEEVEEVISRHPAVAMCRVWGRPSPITGTLIAADVVLAPYHKYEEEFSIIREEIISACRVTLAPYKVPVRINQVMEISVLTSGKIERRYA